MREPLYFSKYKLVAHSIKFSNWKLLLQLLCSAPKAVTSDSDPDKPSGVSTRTAKVLAPAQVISKPDNSSSAEGDNDGEVESRIDTSIPDSRGTDLKF